MMLLLATSAFCRCIIVLDTFLYKVSFNTQGLVFLKQMSGKIGSF